jgi:hypothetical protein
MKLILENWKKFNKINVLAESINKKNLNIAKGLFLERLTELEDVKRQPENLKIIVENVESLYNVTKSMFKEKEAFKIIQEQLEYVLEAQQGRGGRPGTVEHIFFRYMQQAEEELGEEGIEKLTKKIKEGCYLRFSTENSKLGHLKSITLSLPAAFSCPNAGDCKTFAVKTKEKTASGKVKRRLKADKDSLFSCFAAALEVQRPNVANLRWSNYNLILPKGLKRDVYYPEFKQRLVKLIKESFKHHGTGSWDLFRFHDAGDFFRQEYFDAWLEVVESMPEKLFYGYTTSLRFWVERLIKSKDYSGPLVSDLDNLNLIASWASKERHLIKHNKSEIPLRYSKVVYFPQEAEKENLTIDVNESIAAFEKRNFALLLHNVAGQKTKYVDHDTIKELLESMEPKEKKAFSLRWKIDPKQKEPLRIPLGKVAHANNGIIKQMQKEQTKFLTDFAIQAALDQVLKGKWLEEDEYFDVEPDYQSTLELEPEDETLEIEDEMLGIEEPEDEMLGIEEPEDETLEIEEPEEEPVKKKPKKKPAKKKPSSKPKPKKKVKK